jgi:hypothetical protein
MTALPLCLNASSLRGTATVPDLLDRLRADPGPATPPLPPARNQAMAQ